MYCKKGSGKRCSILKSFVVFNPAHLVESVSGILQLSAGDLYIAMCCLCITTDARVHSSLPAGE